MSTHTTKSTSASLPDKWKGYANEDELIDAWTDGKETGFREGREAYSKEITHSFHANLKVVLELSEELHAYIVDELEAKCAVNKVKPEWYDTFESLFAVEAEKYLSKDFRRKVYAKTRELIKKGAELKVHLDFIVTAASPEMNRTSLITNGYWYEFRPTQKRKK